MSKNQIEKIALSIVIASLLFVPTQLCNGPKCVSAGWNFLFTTEYSVDFTKLLIEEAIIGLLFFYFWRNRTKIRVNKPLIKSQFWLDVWKKTKRLWYGLALIYAGRLGFIFGLTVQGFFPSVISALISAFLAVYLTSTLIRFIALKFYKSDIHSAYFEENNHFISSKKFFWIVVSALTLLPFITNYDNFKNISSSLSANDTSTFVKNIRLGNTKEDVLNNLGYPISITSNEVSSPKDLLTSEDAEKYVNNTDHQDMHRWVYKYKNKFITINPNPFLKDVEEYVNKVSEIECEYRETNSDPLLHGIKETSDAYCSYLGIDLLDNEEKVLNQLGHPDGNYFDSLVSGNFEYSKRGVTFTIKDSEVVAIRIYKPRKK